MTARAWDSAPVGLLALRADGTVVDANATVLDWIGRSRDDVVERARLSDLLSVGGRIFWETHLSPLLHVEHRVDEVALELKGPDGRLPVLLTAVMTDGDLVSVALSSARERSRYERELLAARTAADRAADRLQALQDVTEALSQALGVGAVGAALMDAAVGSLGAVAGTLWMTDDEGVLVPTTARAERFAELPTAGLVLHGRVAAQSDGRVVVPLRGSAELQGLLSLVPPTDPGADPLDLEVLTAVGQQAGLALDRAQLYEHSSSVARELQHSLLAVEPPADDRFSVAAVYRPGVEMLEVGGDWYDVFVEEPGVLAVLVGDVVGRGLGAASAMGQLRSAVRAIAGPGVGPARLLSRLDRFVEQVEAAGMATLAYAEVDLESGRVRFACAGHPPPVLLPAEGEVRLLWDGRSTPLGAFTHPVQRGEAEVQLAPGDRLLLYTDGLVERRDRALDDSLQVLVRTAAEVRKLPLEPAVATLTQVLLEDEQVRDDVCVLVLAWNGVVFEQSVASDLTGLSSTRHALRSWLHDRGVRGLAADDLVLATSEAIANAAEHGNHSRPDLSVQLAVRLEQPAHGRDEVVVTVHDRGRWRSPVTELERGRGMTIMRALVDELATDTDDGTRVVLRRRVVREVS